LRENLKERTQVMAARFPEPAVKTVEEIAREESVDRSTIMARALEQYIKQWKLEKALKLYQKGKVTMWKAASIAGLSLWEMMDVVKERKIPLQYTYEDFKEDFEAALKEE